MIVHSETALLEYTWFLNLVQTMDHQRSSKKKKKKSWTEYILLVEVAY